MLARKGRSSSLRSYSLQALSPWNGCNRCSMPSAATRRSWSLTLAVAASAAAGRWPWTDGRPSLNLRSTGKISHCWNPTVVNSSSMQPMPKVYKPASTRDWSSTLRRSVRYLLRMQAVAGTLQTSNSLSALAMARLTLQSVARSTYSVGKE